MKRGPRDQSAVLASKEEVNKRVIIAKEKIFREQFGSGDDFTAVYLYQAGGIKNKLDSIHASLGQMRRNFYIFIDTSLKEDVRIQPFSENRLRLIEQDGFTIMRDIHTQHAKGGILVLAQNEMVCEQVFF